MILVTTAIFITSGVVILHTVNSKIKHYSARQCAHNLEATPTYFLLHMPYIQLQRPFLLPDQFAFLNFA